MLRYSKPSIALAVALAMLAGYVDATGFLSLGGFFVSFMSGNSTRLAVGLASNGSAAAVAAGLIGCFVLGVIAGTLAARLVRQRRRMTVLLLVAVLLAAAAGLGEARLGMFAALVAAAAMGAENATFEREGEVSIGVTYMTGALVKLGQRIASALTGGDRLAWAPYALLWLGLIAGAVTGAAMFPVLGLRGFWIASLAAAALAVVAARVSGETAGG
jgi:uncharacterized membrane protein YoaK (UPF0700 family)